MRRTRIYRFEKISVDVEKAAATNVGRIHFRGTQKHIDFGLCIRIHPAQFDHEQFLLKIGSHVLRCVMGLIADEKQQTYIAHGCHGQADVLDAKSFRYLRHQTINR